MNWRRPVLPWTEDPARWLRRNHYHHQRWAVFACGRKPGEAIGFGARRRIGNWSCITFWCGNKG